MVRGVRNIWVADGPAWMPRQVTPYAGDDGQELTQLHFSPDGTALVYVRGGDHDANWPAAGDHAPNPAEATEEPKVAIWAADPAGSGPPLLLAEGDEPAVSTSGRVAFVKEHAIWSVALDGKDPHRLFYDRGKDAAPSWSPDGEKLLFVSDRTDHGFIGIFAGADHPVVWLAPSTGFDGEPRWSPDGGRVAFVRQPGRGGPPAPLLPVTKRPWAIWVADSASGDGHAVWHSPDTLRGSQPEDGGQSSLDWVDGGRLVFRADLDDWPHLYTIDEKGGTASLLTPGRFMVEDVAVAPDRRSLIYSANAGDRPDDDARRHLFSVAATGGMAKPLTPGEGLEWTPVTTSSGAAFVEAGFATPPSIGFVAGVERRLLGGQEPPAGFPAAALIQPKPVSFPAADGLTIHGQIFAHEAPPGAGRPAVIFIHGGPPRQMLLGWHYMDYYSNAYALNQYLADHGFVVLTVNYRLGIGYGHDFAEPAHAGPAGAAEYQDIVAGGHFLEHMPGVDPARIGLWGGSYGGYLTALGLARDSALFKAGVDLHGVHDWSRSVAEQLPDPDIRAEQGDRAKAMAMAWRSSPDADIDKWRSPVLLIQGDDDRNVHFSETVDLARRLAAHGVPYEELVIPDEIHGFLRYASWLKADKATAEFLARRLEPAR
jgi:dipeptidyl aminopeptidase/acylaminoacyl peptidase